MITTLFVLLSHPLFDWTCRRSKADLVKNLGEVVKVNFSLLPDLSANKKFVSRVSAERIHRDILTRRSWECDPLLHYEMTRHQKIRRGNIRRESYLVILVILCLPVSNMTINESKESERRILYFVTGKYIWNIWTLVKWGAQLKNLSEIFGGRKNERQSQGISNTHFQWALTYSALSTKAL